jgi:hypothetical protein
MGLTKDEYADAFDTVSLRGNLRDVYALRTLFARFARGHYAAVFLDALYRLIPPGVDENSNSDMTPLYNAIDRYADEMGAAFLIVHHASKGVQGNKGVTDVGAGAGAISRATDSHIILREHEQDDVVVMEAACRSFPPLPPLCIEWQYPLWLPAPHLDPTLLRTDRRRPRKEPEEQPAEKIVWTAEKFAESFVTAEARTANAITTKAAAALSERRATKLLATAEEEGLIHRWVFAKRTEPHKFATIPQPVTEAK